MRRVAKNLLRDGPFVLLVLVAIAFAVSLVVRTMVDDSLKVEVNNHEVIIIDTRERGISREISVDVFWEKKLLPL